MKADFGVTERSLSAKTFSMLLKTMGGLVEEAGVSAAVDGDENALPLGSTGEAHVVSRPALQEALKVFDEFFVSGHGGLLSLG